MNSEFEQYMFAPICRRGKTVVYYPDEVFIKNSLFPMYMIGNYGTIFNERNKMKVSQYINGRGYYATSLLSFDGKWTTINIHRIIMLTHCPIPNYETMTVNHIDGNKLNNIYEPNSSRNNLEWCTYQENVIHAYETGLVKKIYTSEEINKICFYMEQGYPNKDAIILAGLEYNEQTSDLAAHIRYNANNVQQDEYKYWNKIIQNYTIPPPEKNYTEYTEKEVIEICELIVQEYTNKEIADMMIEKYNHIFTEGFVNNIRAKKVNKWSHITNLYNFPLLVKPFDFTDEDIHKLCSFIKQNNHYTLSDIRNIINLEDRTDFSVYKFLNKLKRNAIKKYYHMTSLYF